MPHKQSLLQSASTRLFSLVFFLVSFFFFFFLGPSLDTCQVLQHPDGRGERKKKVKSSICPVPLTPPTQQRVFAQGENVNTRAALMAPVWRSAFFLYAPRNRLLHQRHHGWFTRQNVGPVVVTIMSCTVYGRGLKKRRERKKL